MLPGPTAVFSPSGYPGMDLPERMPGASMPATARNIPENPSGGRRPIPNSAATSNGPTPTPSMPTLRKVASSTNLSATDPLPPSQVVALARDALRSALESESQVAEAGVSGAGLKPGVTVDLSRKNIQKIPDEMVNIVKNELERLALSHNQISVLPSRFSECTSLRYLNIRANNIKDFPMSLCDLKSLEILDLGRNQIQVLPPDIAKLTSLKVFSIRKNLIRELPVCLADMGSLQVLKFEGNPLVFPPKEALQAQVSMPPNDPYAREAEVTEIAVTATVKRYLKQYSLNGRVETELPSVDESSETAETPRIHTKRRVSGRFPIKVQGADLPDTRSPSIRGVPPIPQRSHFRGLSQQNTSTRRPGVMPLTLGNANERLRSNSETIIRSERSESRNRRMGVVSKKGSDLGTLDETEANNRFSHYRGLSHGSAMHGAPIGPKEPPTPTEQYPQRPVYVRRLSVLPERRRESKIFDPVVETAKGILYSVFQIHPQIQMLMSLTNDGSAKRSSLEIVFYNTNSHVEELEQEIQKHFVASVDDDDHTPRENESVHRACQTLVSAYGHVCTLLADNIDTFVDNGDPRYIRSLLNSLYASIMELRATLSSVSKEERHSRQPSEADSMHESYTLKPLSQPPSTPSSISRPGITRSRNGTLVHNPANLRVATNVPVPAPYTNGNSQIDVLASATPRSGESFASAISRDVRSDTSEEDAAFENIFLSLQRSADIVLRTLPNFNVQLSGGLRNAMQRGAPPGLIKEWKDLIAMCETFIHQTKVIKNRLSLIKLKEPGVRSQPSFWILCNNFVSSWTDMAYNIKFSINIVALPSDTKTRLKPIQQSMQETSGTILQSPWKDLFHQPEGSLHASNGSHGGNQPMSPTQISITPQSAALGPAMQATVPKTPRNDSFAAAFHGNVFDRADTLMANPGKSMSRPGMPRKGHSNLSSLSSVSSFSSDGANGPPSAMSPSAGMGNGPVRLNGGRAAF